MRRTGAREASIFKTPEPVPLGAVEWEHIGEETFAVHEIIYLIGLIVVISFLLSLLGFR